MEQKKYNVIIYMETSSSNRKTRKIYQKGGLIILGDNMTVFSNFFENSHLEYLTKGSNGFIYRAKIPETAESKYKHLDFSRFGSPVRETIIKFVLLDDSGHRKTVEKNKHLATTMEQNDINFSTTNEFKKEINIQTDIYMKTLKYLQPICPAITYANVFGKNLTELRNKIINKIDPKNAYRDVINGIMHISRRNFSTDNKYLHFIQQLGFVKMLLLGNFQSVGIICMELLQGSESAHLVMRKEQNSNKRKVIAYLCYYLLILLAMETGYTQGDFHLNNIMFNRNVDDYLDGENIRPFMLDFGFAHKIPQKNMKKIRENYSNHDFGGVLKEICDVGRSDNLNLYNYSVYEWACDEDLKDVIDNNVIDAIIEKRDIAISSNIEHFDNLHKDFIDHPEKYSDVPILYGNNPFPYLPISNRFKNHIYNGLIDVTYLSNAQKGTLKESPKKSSNVVHKKTSKTSSPTSSPKVQIIYRDT